MKTLLYKTLALGVMLSFASCSKKNRELIQLPDGTNYWVSYEEIGDSIKIGKYESGDIYYKSHKKSGLSGFTETESFTYYPNGKVRKYAFLLNDSLRYFRFYGLDGKPTEDGGCVMVYLDDNTQYLDTIAVDEPHFQHLKLAMPPHSKIRLIYGDEVESEETRDFDVHPLQLLPIKNDLSGVLIKYSERGIYNKVIYWSVEDTLTGGIQKGVVWRRFVVE